MNGHSLFDMEFYPMSKMQSGLPVTSDSGSVPKPSELPCCLLPT